MKRLFLCEVIVIVCFLALGLMAVTPIFQQPAEAHDNALLCQANMLMTSAFYSSVMYWCYSGEDYDPDKCDLSWKLLGKQSAYTEKVCAHDPDEEHD